MLKSKISKDKRGQNYIIIEIAGYKIMLRPLKRSHPPPLFRQRPNSSCILFKKTSLQAFVSVCPTWSILSPRRLAPLILTSSSPTKNRPSLCTHAGNTAEHTLHNSNVACAMVKTRNQPMVSAPRYVSMDLKISQ